MFLAFDYGFLDWAQFGMALVGLGLGIWALVYAVGQTKAARVQAEKATTAAQAAERASRKAYDRVSDRLMLDELGVLGSFVESLHNALRTKQWDSAAVYSRFARRAIAALRNRDGFDIPDANPSLQDAVTMLADLETQLAVLPNGTSKVQSKNIVRALAKLDSDIGSYSAILRQRQFNKEAAQQ